MASGFSAGHWLSQAPQPRQASSSTIGHKTLRRRNVLIDLSLLS
jgi:hypothetical protein